MSWRLLIVGKLLLLLTAGIHWVMWEGNPNLGVAELFPIVSRNFPGIGNLTKPTTPGQVSFYHDPLPSTPAGRVNQVARRRQPCGKGALFDRRTLSVEPVVLTVPLHSPPASSTIARSLPIGSSALTAGHSTRIVPRATGHCISHVFRDCNMSALDQMGDLLSNGSFVKGALSFKRTGEKAIVDPQVYRRYFLAFECIGVYKPEGDSYASAEKWEHRVASMMQLHPVLSPLHGGVSPARLIGQARYLLKIGGATSILQILNASAAEALNESAASPLNYGILEFGCGHGALLASMCPPVEGVHCHGTDFSPKLIEAGAKHFPWMQLESSTDAPSVGTGSIDLAVSHAVLSYLPEKAVCNHLLEGLRVLKPGGRFVLWMLWVTPFGAATRLHPGFFVSGISWDQLTPYGNFSNASVEADANPQQRFLPFCTGDIGVLVDQVQLWLADASAPIYPPSLNRGGPYGVVLRRGATASSENATHRAPPLNNRSAHKGPAALHEYMKWHRQYSTFRKYDKRSRLWVAH